MSDVGDGKELDEVGYVGGPTDDFEFFGELAVDAEEGAAGREYLVIAASFEEPARGFCVCVSIE